LAGSRANFAAKFKITKLMPNLTKFEKVLIPAQNPYNTNKKQPYIVLKKNKDHSFTLQAVSIHTIPFIKHIKPLPKAA
jgi:hypothetical protein